MANYIPVLEGPLFLAGLVVFAWARRCWCCAAC
jgi:hypothetical protein